MAGYRCRQAAGPEQAAAAASLEGPSQMGGQQVGSPVLQEAQWQEACIFSRHACSMPDEAV